MISEIKSKIYEIYKLKKMIFLTEEERNQLKIQHKKERDGCIRYWIKAVLL